MAPTIILPDRVIRKPDPYISPVYGARGPCNLCGHYSDLTENHVPPESVGNAGLLLAQSYIVASTVRNSQHFPRKFANGLRFRTLCRDCNSRLGGGPDKEIMRFYQAVEKIVQTPFSVPHIVMIAARPNLILKGFFAHFVSATERRMDSPFDIDARDLFFGRKNLRQTKFNLFYWIYLGASQFLIRDAFLGDFSRGMRVTWTQVIKIFPLGVIIADQPSFRGLPNLRNYQQPRDDQETEVPLLVFARESHPTWPIHPDNSNVVLLGGAGSSGLIARPA